MTLISHSKNNFEICDIMKVEYKYCEMISYIPAWLPIATALHCITSPRGQSVKEVLNISEVAAENIVKITSIQRQT